jgi:hypothetical protein
MPFPSYLDLLQDNPRVSPHNAMPRWWIAYGRKPVERDTDGLAWRLSPPGLEVRTAARRLDAAGRLAADAANDSIAQDWADAMTARYDELAAHEPAFAQLRGCMDLALATAVLASGDLLGRIGLELPMLMDVNRLQLASQPAPISVASHAVAVRRRGEWLIAVSGGVELDVASAVNAAAVKPELIKVQTDALPNDAASWWWD